MAKEAAAAESAAAEQQEAAVESDKDNAAEVAPALKYSEKDIEEGHRQGGRAFRQDRRICESLSWRGCN